MIAKFFRRFVCVMFDGGHRFNVKFHHEPGRSGTNVKRTLVCTRCEHETAYDKFGW